MKIAQVPWMLGEDVPVLAPDTPVAAAAKQLNENRIGLAVVVDGLGKVLGVITKTDIVQVAADWPSRLDDLRITHLFTREPLTCTAEDDARALFDTMIKRDIRHVPLVEDGRLAGLVSYENLRNYLASGPPAPAKPAAPPQPRERRPVREPEWGDDPPPIDPLIQHDDLEETPVESIAEFIEDPLGTSEPQGNRRKRWPRALAVIAVIVGILMFSLDGLNQLVSFEPELGEGLMIQKVRSFRQVLEGEDALIVRGHIANTSGTVRSIPGVEVTLFDGNDNKLQSTVVASSLPQLAPKETTEFRATVRRPSPLAQRIEVRADSI